MTSARDILRGSRYARNEVRELLQGVFVSELLQPSEELWLVSPWISDVPVIDDAAGAFGSIAGAPFESAMTLSAAITALAEMGTDIRIVTRPGESADFCDVLKRRIEMSSAQGRVRIGLKEALHTKGLVGEDYRVMGSMNFTFNGVQLNDEAIHFDLDSEAVSRVRLEFEQQYGDLID